MRARLLVVALLLSNAPAALAGAGGGSGGYGGGGGGGGYSGGAGSGTGGSFSLPGLLLIVGIFVAVMLLAAIGTWRYGRKRRARHARVTAAAAQAAEDDADFAADTVVEEAADLYLACQEAWDRRDRRRLADLVGGDLLVEWRRRLDDFDRKGWHNRVKVHGRPAVEYLGLVNRAGEQDDRVTVRITATQDDYVQTSSGVVNKDGAASRTVSVAEWWTLAQRDDRWIVVSIETEEEGKHHLDSRIVAVPEADDATLRDESLVEVAQADAAPAGVSTAEIADLDFEGTAREAALDLALADARFAPDVLEVAVRRAVAGWTEAIDGEDAPLLTVAEPDVADRLLHPRGDRTRMVVRGPRIGRMRITRLDAAAEPARMSVEVDVTGRRYVEDRDTTDVLSGSKSSETSFTERWTLAINGSTENPWRIITSE